MCWQTLWTRKLTLLFAVLFPLLTLSVRGNTTLIPSGATWQYLDNGTDQGAAWRQLVFDASAWKTGAAELGYGDGDEVTVIEDDATPGSPTPGSTTRYITSYFRHIFTVTDKNALSSLVLSVKRDDGAVVYLNGTVISNSTIQNGLSNNPAYTNTANNASDDGITFFAVNLVNGQNLLVEGNNIIAVEVHQSSGLSSDVSFDLSLTAVRGAEALISVGSTWNYLDNGTNQGTAWKEPTFVATGWKTGVAEFGYGDGDETTLVSYGPNRRARYITTYFRKTFTVTDPQSAYQSMKVRLLRDDGAVVYLNGNEVRRDNLPKGAITYTTQALKSVNYPAEATFFETTLPASALVDGTNTVAVELHLNQPSGSDVSFDFELVGVPASTATTTDTRAPYLQMGTPTSVVVRWRTLTPTESRVSVGTDPGTLSTHFDNPAVTQEHEILVDGLTPNTQYYYSAGSTTATDWSGTDFTFFTAPPVGTQQPVRVWVLGDSGTGDQNQRNVRDAYTAFAGTRYTDLWLMLGDNVYEKGDDADYTAKVFGIYPTTLRQSVLWPAIGNHDTALSPTPSNPALTIPYFQSFTMPANGEAGGVPSGTEKYYSFDYANIHFICLDSMTSNRSAPTAAGGVMARWLIEDLHATTQEWIIAYWHHPPFSKGSHDSDAAGETSDMRNVFVPIMEAGGVDLVLGGHSHNYERSYLIDGFSGTAGTFTNAKKLDGGSGRDASAYQKINSLPHQGAVYAVCGTSGKIGGGAMNHPAMYIGLAKLGSMVLDFDGPRLDVKFLRDTGAIDDYFTIIKKLPAPTGLTATAGDGMVKLSWSAVDTAASYSVKRATTSGGSYVVVASGLSQTSFTDFNLTNEQPYCYVVSATSPSGESSDSPEVTATPAPLPPPAAPTDLVATGSTTSSINLAWTDHATNELGYRIERSSDGVTYAEIASVEADVTTYTSTGLRSGRSYYFRVRAYHESASSDYSNVLQATATAP